MLFYVFVRHLSVTKKAMCGVACKGCVVCRVGCIRTGDVVCCL
jgi:hypothetical protein